MFSCASMQSFCFKCALIKLSVGPPRKREMEKQEQRNVDTFFVCSLKGKDVVFLRKQLSCSAE